MCCTCDFFETLYWEGINSLLKFEAPEGIKNVFRMIRKKASPELEDTLDRTNVNRETEIFMDLMPPPGLEDYDSVMPNPEVSEAPPCSHDFSVRHRTTVGPHDLRIIEQISFFIRNFLKLTLKGHAYIMICDYEMINSNGIDMFKRLFEVYGRTPEHTATIPWIFDWSNSATEQKWIEYKTV